MDCDDCVQKVIKESDWKTLGTTEARRLRTKSQADFERRRVAQAHPQILWIHLRGALGTSAKTKKNALKPFEHTVDLGVHMLDRKSYVIFECQEKSQLLRCEMF